MVGAYKCLYLYLLEINGHLAPIQKYVHVSKISEIVNNFFSRSNKHCSQQ
jgi:hypothetical protein